MSKNSRGLRDLVDHVTKISRKNVLRPGLRAVYICQDCGRRQHFWHRILDRAEVVHFHGSTFCFPLCFERELLRRLERSAVAVPPADLRPRRIPIGLLMLSRGNLTNQQLQRALDRQKQAGAGRIGAWLRRMALAQDQDVTAALAMQWSCPLLRKLPSEIHTCGLPTFLLQKFRMVPIHFSRANGKLHIAFADVIPYPALVAVEQMLEIKTEVCLTIQPELDAALALMEQIPQRPHAIEIVFENLSGREEIVRIISAYADRLSAVEVRSAACGDYFWTRILAGKNATDLIFSCKRFRSDDQFNGGMTCGTNTAQIRS